MEDIQYKELEIGSWDCRIVLAMGGTSDNAEYITEKIFDSEPDQKTCQAENTERGAFHYFDGYKGGTLWVKDLPVTPETIAILAHEATHASNHILGMSGVIIDTLDMNDEPQSYLVQHLMSEFLKWAWRINSEKTQKPLDHHNI